MDIFTTQLTRVVPVPIKPEKLRVKAPAKEGAIKQVVKEKNPITEMSYVPVTDKEENENDRNQGKDDFAQEHASKGKKGNDEQATQKDKGDGTQHLDIYV